MCFLKLSAALSCRAAKPFLMFLNFNFICIDALPTCPISNPPKQKRESDPGNWSCSKLLTALWALLTAESALQPRVNLRVTEKARGAAASAPLYP